MSETRAKHIFYTQFQKDCRTTFALNDDDDYPNTLKNYFPVHRRETFHHTVCVCVYVYVCVYYTRTRTIF